MKRRAIFCALTITLTLLALCAGAKAQTDGVLAPGAFLAQSATGNTSTVSATLTGVPTQFTYLCGFNVTSAATAAQVGNMTIAGVQTTLTFQMPSAATPATATLQQSFEPCLRSAAQAGNIVLTTPTLAGGGNTSVNVWGYTR